MTDNKLSSLKHLTLLTGSPQSNRLIPSSVVISCEAHVVTKNPALICLTHSHLKQTVQLTQVSPSPCYLPIIITLIFNQVSTIYNSLQINIELAIIFSFAKCLEK